MRSEGKDGRLDSDRNAPGRVLARALHERITADYGSGLPRIRRDEVAGYKVPALPDHVADLDLVAVGEQQRPRSAPAEPTPGG